MQLTANVSGNVLGVMFVTGLHLHVGCGYVGGAVV